MPNLRTVDVPPDVRSVLADATILADRLTLPDQLDRPLYVRVDKVLKAAGGKWNTKAGAHLFQEDPRQVLGIALETGKVVDDKKSRQAFYTPDWLAEELVAFAGIDDECCRVLEPSAGDGSLVKSAIGAGATTVCAVEIDRLCCDRLNLLATDDCIIDVHHQTFETFDPGHEVYDACVMNPPFDHVIEHVTKAASMVKDDGIVAAIMPAGIKFREDKKWASLRNHIKSTGGWFQSNPDHSFEASGTRVSTVTAVFPGGFKLPPKQLILL